MRYLRLALLPLLLVACTERQPAAPDIDVRPEFRANGGWIDWYLEFGPGDFVFPAACIDEDMTFVGNMWFRDHMVSPPGAPHGGQVHDNWEIWYEGEFSSVTTGKQWDVLHLTNHGIWWGFTRFEHSASHEFIWLEEEGTGRQIQTRLWGHFVKNANGEVTVDNWEFTCYVQ